MASVSENGKGIVVDVPVYVRKFERLPEGTIRVSKQQYRDHLRWRFLEHLRGRARFRFVVQQDLRPLWRDLKRRTSGDATFEDLPRDDPYTIALRELVGTKLRCSNKGQPDPWLLHEIHNIVSKDARLPITVLRRDQVIGGQLRINVSSNGIAKTTRIESDPNGEPVSVTLPVEGPYAAFDDWAALKRQAHTELDELLAAVQRTFEESTSDHKPKQVSRLLKAKDHDLAELVDYLWENRTVPGRRDTRRRLLDELGFDHPKATRKI